MTYNHDATRFAFADIDDLEVHLLDGRGKEVHVLRDLPVGSRFLDFDDRDGSLWIGMDGRVAGFDRDGRPIGELRTAGGPVGVLLADGDRVWTVWTGTSDGVIRAWRRDGLRLATLGGHRGDLTMLDRAGENVVSGSLDGTMRVWDRDASQLQPFETSRCTTGALGVDRDGSTVVIACRGGGVVVWRDGGARQTWLDAPGRFVDVAVAPRAQRIAATDADGRAIGWKGDATAASPLPDHGGAPVTALEFMSDQELAGLADGGRVVIWDLAGGTARVVWQDDARKLGLLTALPSGDLVMADHRSRILVLRPREPGAFYHPVAEIERGSPVASLGVAPGRPPRRRPGRWARADSAPARPHPRTRAALQRDGPVRRRTARRRHPAHDQRRRRRRRAAGAAERPVAGDPPHRIGTRPQSGLHARALIVWIEHGWARWSIARDRRPAAELQRELACRLPLRLDGATLVPATPTCGPEADDRGVLANPLP